MVVAPRADAFLGELPQLVRERDARIAVGNLERRTNEAILRQQTGRLIAGAEEVEHARRITRLLERRRVELAPRPPEQIRVAREIAGAGNRHRALHRFLQAAKLRRARIPTRIARLVVEQDGFHDGPEIAALACAVVGEHGGNARDVVARRIARDEELNQFLADERRDVRMLEEIAKRVIHVAHPVLHRHCTRWDCESVVQCLRAEVMFLRPHLHRHG